MCQVSVYRDGLSDGCAVNETAEEVPPLEHESLSCHPNSEWWEGGRRDQHHEIITATKQEPQRYLAMASLSLSSPSLHSPA